jgi:hypothetical protein
LYPCAMVGEAALQACAWYDPEAFLRGALAFMIPYKAASFAALAAAAWNEPDVEERMDLLRIAVQWLVPGVLLVAAWAWDAKD